MKLSYEYADFECHTTVRCMMNEKKIQKLDSDKIIKDVSELIGEENVDHGGYFTDHDAAQVESADTNTRFYSAIGKIIQKLQTIGVYRFIQPFVRLLHKFLRLSYKIPLFGKLLYKVVRVLLKRKNDA